MTPICQCFRCRGTLDLDRAVSDRHDRRAFPYDVGIGVWHEAKADAQSKKLKEKLAYVKSCANSGLADHYRQRDWYPGATSSSFRWGILFLPTYLLSPRKIYESMIRLSREGCTFAERKKCRRRGLFGSIRGDRYRHGCRHGDRNEDVFRQDTRSCRYDAEGIASSKRISSRSPDFFSTVSISIMAVLTVVLLFDHHGDPHHSGTRRVDAHRRHPGRVCRQS